MFFLEPLSLSFAPLRESSVMKKPLYIAATMILCGSVVGCKFSKQVSRKAAK